MGSGCHERYVRGVRGGGNPSLSNDGGELSAGLAQPLQHTGVRAVTERPETRRIGCARSSPPTPSASPPLLSGIRLAEATGRGQSAMSSTLPEFEAWMDSVGITYNKELIRLAAGCDGCSGAAWGVMAAKDVQEVGRLVLSQCHCRRAAGCGQ